MLHGGRYLWSVMGAAAASSCVALRPVPHAAELLREAKTRLSDLSAADRNLRQVAMLLGRFLPRGVAVHHAGLLPQVKLLVEEFFQARRAPAVRRATPSPSSRNPRKETAEIRRT